MTDRQREEGTSDAGARDERVGRGVREGMEGGVSRNAHTSGERRPGSGADHGTGGYGDSSGFVEGTTAADEGDRARGSSSLKPKSHPADDVADRVPAQTRTDDVGKQAPSGMEDEEAR